MHILLLVMVIFLSKGKSETHMLQASSDGSKDELLVCQSKGAFLTSELKGKVSKDDPTLSIVDVEYKCVQLTEATPA